MLQSPVKLVVIALALVASCSQTRTGASSDNARIAGALDAASVVGMRGQPVNVSVVGTQLATSIDATGRFSLAGLAAGVAQLRFVGQGIDSTLRVSGLVPKQTRQIAVRISSKGAFLLTSDNEVSFVGAIDAIAAGAPNVLTISGLEVDVDDSTRVVARGATIPLANLKQNQIVSVEGTLASGKVLARLVDLLLPANFDQVLLRGTVDSIAAPNFVVSGLTIVTNASTRFRQGGSLSSLAVGDRVAVQGALQPDGTVVANIVRDLDQEDVHVVEVEGAIQSITAPDTLVVAGVTVTVNADTRIEAEDEDGDNRGPGGGRGRDLRDLRDEEADLTFADLVVGEQVEVEGLAQADGSVLALRIEVENEMEPVEEHSGSH